MARLGVVLGAVGAVLLLVVGGVLAYLLPLGQAGQPAQTSDQVPVAAAQVPPLNPAASSRGITVFGEGTASARPDQAWVSAGVQVSRPTAAEALDEANRVTEAILAKLDELGIARTNVQTSGLNLFPIQDGGPRPTPGNQPQITGYQAVNQLTVLVGDLGKVGQVLDQVVAAGANMVGGVRFGLKDDAALRGQALDQAVRAARPRAEAMARALNLAVGEVLEVREEGTFSPVPDGAGAGLAQKASNVPIEGGELSLRLRVQVTFTLTPAP